MTPATVFPRLIVFTLSALLLASAAVADEVATSGATNAPPAVPAAAADLGVPLELGFETDASVLLRGRDAQRQLVVVAKFAGGAARDFTRQVAFAMAPAGIVSVDSTGLMTPLADGKATLTAQGPAGLQAAIEVTVDHFVDDPQVNFPNQIVPIFTKLGCNSGGCHGKASGQNGFRLSLLGFEPGEDYEHLVKEARGRRLFPAAPDRSLLLTKPINAIPHGGGQRLDRDSLEYRLLRRWITQGMPYGKDTDPKVARIQVLPEHAIMSRRGEQQIAVLAHYTDGSVEDVTRLAQFDPNDGEMAEVSNHGLVKTLDLTGDVAVMARYQGNVGVFRANVPLGAAVEGCRRLRTLSMTRFSPN